MYPDVRNSPSKGKSKQDPRRWQAHWWDFHPLAEHLQRLFPKSSLQVLSNSAISLKTRRVVFCVNNIHLPPFSALNTWKSLFFIKAVFGRLSRSNLEQPRFL